MKQSIFITAFLIFSFSCSFINAQVGINNDNTDPDASAMLDVKSTDKGLLVPRMNSADRTNISAPANGLLVFDTTTNSFWFFKNSAWAELKVGAVLDAITDADNDTKIRVERSPDIDQIRFTLEGTNMLDLKKNANGDLLMRPENSNVFLGRISGENNTGTLNSFVGNRAGLLNTTGYGNSFFGNDAGQQNTTGNWNSFFGIGAGLNNTTGSHNSFFGNSAGFLNMTGEKNVFLGNQSGYFELGSNKLYIENSQSSFPLIYGEFDNDLLRFNGKVGIYGDPDASAMLDIQSTDKGLLVPRMSSADRTNINAPANGLLVFDNTTNSFWFFKNNLWVEIDKNNGIPKSIADTDADTKIQVEEGPDEDVIRFDVAGTEVFTVGKNSNGDGIIQQVSENVIIGRQAGLDNSNGTRNIMIGADAGKSAQDGNHNVFLGYRTGIENNGNGNVFLGSAAGLLNKGSNNVFIGDNSGKDNANGSGNVFIGKNTGGTELGSNKLYIDNTNTATPLIYGDFDNDLLKLNGEVEIGNNNLKVLDNGNVGVGGAVSDTKFLVLGSSTNWSFIVNPDGTQVALGVKADGDIVMSLPPSTVNGLKDIRYNINTGKISYRTSSRRYKKDIHPANLHTDLDKYLSLDVSAFNYNADTSGIFDYGFIAEEVDSLNLTHPLSWKKDGLVESLNFGHIAFYNFEAAKQHHQRIEELENANEILQTNLSAVQAELSACQPLKLEIDDLKQQMADLKVMLQSTPNNTSPYSEK